MASPSIIDIEADRNRTLEEDYSKGNQADDIERNRLTTRVDQIRTEVRDSTRLKKAAVVGKETMDSCAQVVECELICLQKTNAVENVS